MSQHQRRTGEVQHRHCCRAGDKTTINLQPQRARIPSTVISGTAVEKLDSCPSAFQLLLAQCPSWVFMPPHLALQLITRMSFMRSSRLPSERSHLRDIYTYVVISPPELDWPKILVQHHWPLWCRSDYWYWSESIKIMFLLWFRHG